MEVIKIKELVEEGRNLIFYDTDVELCYDELKDDYICVYFFEPSPAKVRLLEIAKRLKRSHNMKTKTVPEIKKYIIDELGDDRLILLFNHFERLNNQSVKPYMDLNENENIQFICSFSDNFNKKLYPFFEEFKLMNNDKFEKEAVINEINVTYAVYALISLFCFLIYMKIATTVYMAVILIGGIWFALMIFRTLMYAGGRI